MSQILITVLELAISDLAHSSEQLITNGLKDITPISLIIVFAGGMLTSLGPCALSLLPITIAYLAGFNDKQTPFIRSLAFCTGIVISLIFLGSLSGLFGKIYGQLPVEFSSLVSILAIVMGLNLLGIIKFRMFNGPDLNSFKERFPKPIAPIAAGVAFGMAASPCTTPVLAVLLAWISQNSSPVRGMLLLGCFGFGQVMPLLLAGTAAASIPNLLALRPIGKWIPVLSGLIFLTTGSLSLLSRWI